VIKERLITLLTALAALGLVFFLFIPQHAESNLPLSLPSSEDRGADGLKGLYQWLQSQKIPVLSYRKPYTDLENTAELAINGNLLIINLPSPKPIRASRKTSLHEIISA
jgi:predicted PurR-regulated permease PerM